MPYEQLWKGPSHGTDHGQESRNGTCSVYNRRYEWDAFLHCVSIAADRIVCLEGSCIVELSIDDVDGVVELTLRL